MHPFPSSVSLNTKEEQQDCARKRHCTEQDSSVHPLHTLHQIWCRLAAVPGRGALERRARGRVRRRRASGYLFFTPLPTEVGRGVKMPLEKFYEKFVKIGLPGRCKVYSAEIAHMKNRKTNRTSFAHIAPGHMFWKSENTVKNRQL